VIPESEYVLQYAVPVAGNKLVASYLQDVKARVSGGSTRTRFLSDILSRCAGCVESVYA
jgi:hypothetical protein